MLPITVDVARVPILLVGNGEAARRRLWLLDRAGARCLGVYADAAEPDLAAAAGPRLRRRWPDADEVASARLVFLARVGEPAASQLHQFALGAGVLLNVEDDIARSDFHSPSVMRRGELTVAISTGGKCPALSAAIGRRIEALFGAEWEIEIERVAGLRDGWRAAGHDAATIARLTTIWFDSRAFAEKAE